ncbi:beta-lactamase-like protein [Radiomyces spectabilis]|uniref:beta-lactamase-like protein n=1 Tax=Radiomyces spectabilis TaxID=64574 RepID=UPI002220159B|nr:beta-lactamase-like protein [Radiomyces spectabilis]KAI8394231.1 beta-lactamase-like protein [Radiomyces spectabilis]
MTEALLTLPSSVRLSECVWRILGLNPGKFTLQGTNTYLLGKGRKKLLIDSGEGVPEYVSLLKQTLQESSPDAAISDIIISHGHRDHWGGIRDILSSVDLNPDNDIRVHKFPLSTGSCSGHMEHFPSDIDLQPMHHGQIFTADGVTLRVVYTPGHTKDHCTFWLEEEQSLFTADCVLGHGSAVFEDLSSYMDGLQQLRQLQPKKLYPGHGPVIENGVAKIDEYIQHRQYREQQVIHLMKTNRDRNWTVMDIVEELYKDYPPSLHLPAAGGIVLHLRKLQKDGLVRTACDVQMEDMRTKVWEWHDEETPKV